MTAIFPPLACETARLKSSSVQPGRASPAEGMVITGTELRRLVDAAFRSAGVSRTVAFELGQLTEMVRFARAGLGTAIVPRSFAADLAAAGRPAAGVLELADRGLTMTIGAYRPAEAALPAARALLDVASRRDELRREFAYAHR